MNEDTQRTRRWSVAKIVVVSVALVSLLGNLSWGAVWLHGYSLSLLEEKFREEKAVKCTDSRIPFDVLPVIEESGYPVELVMSLIYVESRGNPTAKSPDGQCLGLMMVDKRHCQHLGIEEDDLWIPRINVWAGLQILAERQAKYPKFERDYICAYNCPDDKMEDHLVKGRPLPKETQIHWKRYQAEKARYVKLLKEGVWTER